MIGFFASYKKHSSGGNIVQFFKSIAYILILNALGLAIFFLGYTIGISKPAAPAQAVSVATEEKVIIVAPLVSAPDNINPLLEEGWRIKTSYSQGRGSGWDLRWFHLVRDKR